ncbi:MAG TPA: polysaccharide biosynthesis protein, partial [Phycisphaerales bacterium]|nr:polysaccharide biosynthesis protein [Phycisphaerales bacterium]
LILMERAENALFEIDLQLARRFPDVPRRAILHDVVDAEQTLRHLVQTAPQVVFHAAAHKHVPLMEDHPAHAVTNNLFGTKAIADAAVAVGAERFVLISTDKAVNPTSVMGATKRLAEVYVRWLGGRAGTPTRCSMVRFGNVLGSACSVLTIWSQQVAEGGPITVTDPRMTRYFMTIPEAAALVIQSAAIAPDGARGAPVYVLDMGPPVRILDLAERFVRAHGLVPRIVQGPGAAPPSRDGPAIDIVMTGARPGEKLHEELAYPAEALGGTPFPGINAWAGPAPEGQDPLGVTQMVAELSMVRHGQDRAAVLAALRRHVPGLRPGEG